MKLGNLLLLLMVTACTALADGLPVITTHPQSQTSSPGVPVTFSVVSANATGFQWRFNGADISGATSSTLQIVSAQTANSGYYMVVAKNATGWAPSQLAYLAVVASAGRVPFSNYGIPSAQAFMFYPITSGAARIFAGPELDQMQPVLETFPFTGVASAPIRGGYFTHIAVQVPTASPGQTVYYRVDLTETNGSVVQTLPSRVLTLVAGGGVYPVPSMSALQCPSYIEWPDPFLYGPPGTPTNQVRVPGETVTLAVSYWCCDDFGSVQFQWRKDGINIPGATNFVFVPLGGGAGQSQPFLTITNVQAADAGNYDLVVKGSYSFVDLKTTLSLQLTNGPGVLVSPRMGGAQFVCDLLGVAGRSYAIQWSSNLSSWNDLQTVPNATGTASFTDTPASTGTRYYRARLLP